MKLYFENRYGEERVIAEVQNEQEAMKEIKKFLDDHKYKSYYTRSWIANGRKWYDVGSHSEFFILDLGGNNNADIYVGLYEWIVMAWSISISAGQYFCWIFISSIMTPYPIMS